MNDQDAKIALMQGLMTAILDQAREAGTKGLHGSTIYFAMMEQGITFQQYKAVMAKLVQIGALTTDGNGVYHFVPGRVNNQGIALQ